MRTNRKQTWTKIIAAVSITTCMLTGCGGGTAAMIDTTALADDLYAGVTWADQLSEVELEKGLNLYGISEESVLSGKIYMSTNATAEEIAVLEASSADTVSELEEGVQNRVAAQLTSFQSYNAEEVPKLEQPLILTKGTYVILCVCDDTAEAEDIIDSCFAE